MERYLLFDGKCAVCTSLARNIERETNGWLVAHSLRDPEIQRTLARARPEWRWEPTLLEIKHDRIRVYTGMAMRLRILMGVGLRKAIRIARLVEQSTYSPLGAERRDFLRRSLMMFGLFMVSPRAKLEERPEPGSVNVIWLSHNDAVNLVQSASESTDVNTLAQWLARTEDWKVDTLVPFRIESQRVNDYGVIFLDTATSGIIIYTQRYGAAAVLTGQDTPDQVFTAKGHLIQQVPSENLPRVTVNWSLLHSARSLAGLRPDYSILQRDCCTACLTCLGANAVCILLAACCFSGGFVCCPVGPGVCASAIASCTGSLGCDCLRAC